MRHIRNITILFIVLINTGCVGTFLTRVGDSPVGRYPGEAVYCTGKGMGECVDKTFHGEPAQILAVPLLIISLPIDIGFDTALLPFDLVFWCFGYDKNGLYKRGFYRS